VLSPIKEVTEMMKKSPYARETLFIIIASLRCSSEPFEIMGLIWKYVPSKFLDSPLQYKVSCF